MKYSRTNRGFRSIAFVDRYDVRCSVQESSLGTEHAVTLGVNDSEPKILTSEGWQKVTIPGMLTKTQMHLTINDVTALLPILNFFVAHRKLPSETELDELMNEAINEKA